MLTKLDAVNRILRAASEPPVDSLTVSPTNESLMAEQVLDETNIQFQAHGLTVNTSILSFIPDPGTFEIVLPDTALQVMAWWDENRGNPDFLDSRDFDVVQRRVASITKLYDRKKNTFLFEDVDSVTLKIVLLMDFEELPAAIQFMIIDHAARLYEASTQGDPAMAALLAANSGLSRALGRAHDWRTREFNAYITGQSSGPKRMNRVPRDWR
jgi:hypothetical protein